MIDFERRRIRSRIEAALLAAGDDDRSAIGRFKGETLPDLTGHVVEIGPGTGVNFRHYSPGARLTVIEPNPVMRDRLEATAAAIEPPLDLDVRNLRGESVDLVVGTADAVVGTLLLCGVDDPHRVVTEIRRILKPGGRFVFVEHVAAPGGSTTARVQRLLRRPHHWMFNGCRTDQVTESILRSFEWTELDVTAIDLGRQAAYVRHQIYGIATR